MGEGLALDSLYSAPLPVAQPLDSLYSAPPAEVVPLDGLYGAPPPEELPSYHEVIPAPSDPVTVPTPTPAPTTPAPMMMMDPSYSFQFSNEDSQRSEANDINNIRTGSYGYKTPGGEDILVRYRAGPGIGFVVENADEVAAAIERSAGEVAPANVRVTPYSGEAAEVEFRTPGVDASMALGKNYNYGYEVSDKAVSQKADKDGEVSGSYSYIMEDGSNIVVRYTAGKDGFVVENLEDVMSKVNAASEASEAAEEDLGQYGAAPVVTAHRAHAAPVAEVTVAKVDHAPVSDDYADYEPYVHVDIPAEPYVHVDMPYVHEEIPAEVYVHEEPDYVEAAPVVAAKLTPPASSHQKKNIKRKRVQVNKHESSAASATSAAGQAFSYEAIAEDHEITESADAENERVGSYTYLTPEGDRITVRYSAGKNGFVILNPEEVLPQPVTA